MTPELRRAIERMTHDQLAELEAVMVEAKAKRLDDAKAKHCRIEPCDSFGKYALDVRINGQWQHFHTDYLCVVERMAKAIAARGCKPNPPDVG